MKYEIDWTEDWEEEEIVGNIKITNGDLVIEIPNSRSDITVTQMYKYLKDMWSEEEITTEFPFTER